MKGTNNYRSVKRAVLISPYKGTLPPESLKGPYSFGPCQKNFEDIPFHNHIEFEIAIRRTLSLQSTSATSTRAALRLHS